MQIIRAKFQNIPLNEMKYKISTSISFWNKYCHNGYTVHRIGDVFFFKYLKGENKADFFCNLFSMLNGCLVYFAEKSCYASPNYLEDMRWGQLDEWFSVFRNVRRNTKVRRWLRLWHYPTNIANKFTLPQPPAYPKQKKMLKIFYIFFRWEKR